MSHPPLRRRFFHNLSWVVIGNGMHAVFQFLLNIYVTRSLSTDDFGLINYAAALIAFFTAIGTLGLPSTITRDFTEDESRTGVRLGSGLFSRGAFALVAMVLLQILVRAMNPSDPALPMIVFFQSFSIFFGSADLFVYWFNYRGRANTVALLRFLSFVPSALWRVIVIATTKNLTAYMAGVAAESTLFAILLFLAYLRRGGLRLRFSAAELRRMLRLSAPFIGAALLVTIYGETDRIMLKMLMDNTSVALYSAALTLAGAISILPSALIEGFRPEIMTAAFSDREAYHRWLRRLYSAVFWTSIAYCVFISLTAPYLVRFLYGEAYAEAAGALSVVVWYTAFSYFGGVSNLYLVAEGRTGYTLLLTAGGAVCNIILNFILIPPCGILGAAVASLATQIFANFLLPMAIPAMRACVKDMLGGILFRDLFPRA